VRSNRASRHIITLSWFEGGSGYSAATQRGEFLMKELSDAAVAFRRGGIYLRRTRRSNAGNLECRAQGSGIDWNWIGT
jgi:hypothetical protein